MQFVFKQREGQMMRVQFWGTRGSIATPGPSTVRYGGNTSCVSVNTRSGSLLVLDAGTGLRGLGLALMESDSKVRRGHLLIGHTHWDHIQGFPFFAPFFEPDWQWDVYAPRGFGASLRETLAGQMQYEYFPVNIDDMGATIRYHDLVEGSFMVDDVRVTARYLNHTALTLGYRLDADGIGLVYASDHECHAQSAALGAPLGQVLRALHPGDARHRDFLAGADLVIHDTQYTAAEYLQRVGWGHSTWEYALNLAMSAGVRSLALFHHDPGRDDDALDRVVADARARVDAADAALEVFAAAEGSVVELNAPAGPTVAVPGGGVLAVETADLSDKQVLVACSDAALTERLRAAAKAEGIPAVSATCRQQATAASDPQRLALAVVARRLGNDDGLALVETLRAGAGLANLPAIMVAAASDCPNSSADYAAQGDTPMAGTPITEWLDPASTPAYLRSKLRAAILGTRARWLAAAQRQDEAGRLAALRQLAILDTEPEERFDRITRLAAQMFKVPIALVSLVDENRQWFKSHTGLSAKQTSRDESFCAHAILHTQALVVPDALCDDRFADNPLVKSNPNVRFYAGQPIAAPDGSLIGTLCVIDHMPRKFGDEDIKALGDLAAMVERELDAQR